MAALNKLIYMGLFVMYFIILNMYNLIRESVHFAVG